MAARPFITPSGDQFDKSQPLSCGLLMILILSGAFIILVLKGEILAPSRYIDEPDPVMRMLFYILSF
jgi:hypothetical protein